MKFLALGDSYTIGEGVPPHQRWPERLAQLIRTRGISVEPVHIVAQTGWTTSELLEALQKEEPAPKYDLVTLLIGVNNQYRGLDIDSYTSEFNSCLTKAIHYAGGHAQHVGVISIPDWGVSPFAQGRGRENIAQQIDAFNKANQTQTSLQGAQYVSITALSRSLVEPHHFADDGLHPSNEAYDRWAKEIDQALVSIC